MEKEKMFYRMRDRVGLMQFRLKFSVLGCVSVMASFPLLSLFLGEDKQERIPSKPAFLWQAARTSTQLPGGQAPWASRH